MTRTGRPRSITAADFERLLRADELVPSYQPIVALQTRRVVGYEALARWPHVGDAAPADVFARAATLGRVPDLDWACRAAAVRGALAEGLSPDLSLFVNVEPESVGVPAPASARPILDRAATRLRIVLELTERALSTRPGELMSTVEAARARGMGIALDDVGAHPSSLAVLPFVMPDVIKLDLSLVQQIPTQQQSRVLTTVMAHAERTGAWLLAEGVETEAHLEQAVGIGARLGQGHYFGAPGAIAADGVATARIPFGQSYEPPPRTPFDAVAGSPFLRIGRRPFVAALSRFVENQAAEHASSTVVLAAFQTADRFTDGVRQNYERLAEVSPLVGVLGQGLTRSATSRLHTASFADDDPLRSEWTLVVVGDHYAGAVIGRDIDSAQDGSGPDEEDRRFEFCVTHDRATVLAAGRSLMSRLVDTSA